MNALQVALVLTLLAPLAGVAAQTWTVPPRVPVTSEEVRLSDLVPDAPAEWGRVALGKAPKPGGQRVVNRDWILQRAKEAGAQASLVVPEVVVLTRAGRSVDREELIQAVKAGLVSRIAGGETLRVTQVGLPGPVPEGDVELDVCSPEGDLPASATVWVDVLVGGRKEGRGWARVEVTRARPAVVLTRSARKGEVLASEDVEVRADKTPLRGRPLSDPSDVVGKRLVRSLSAGAALNGSDVEEPPLVGKGDLVRLVVRVGTVVASVTGRALGPARAGEGLRVENLASGRVVQGTLREVGVVDVPSGDGR